MKYDWLVELMQGAKRVVVGGILPVCGARRLDAAASRFSTAAQLCAFASSSAGCTQARFPHTSGARVRISEITQSKKQATKVTCFLMAEKEGGVPYAQFSPIPYYTWV